MRNRALLFFVVSVFFLNGCAVVLQKGRRADVKKIQTLETELDKLRNARDLLADRLSQEIEDQQVSLNLAEKGLVITFVAEVLFDSGKAQLRNDSKPILDKVARILQEEVYENDVGIEGHTDNEPIKYSRWKTNWELSAQRALSVIYYLQERGIAPTRLSARGYGEFQPVASNTTKEGRQLNRRVEIVILPKVVKKEDAIDESVLSQDEYDDLSYGEELK
jgi:chemotaxis protein MotB